MKVCWVIFLASVVHFAAWPAVGAGGEIPRCFGPESVPCPPGGYATAKICRQPCGDESAGDRYRFGVDCEAGWKAVDGECVGWEEGETRFYPGGGLARERSSAGPWRSPLRGRSDRHQIEIPWACPMTPQFLKKSEIPAQALFSVWVVSRKDKREHLVSEEMHQIFSKMTSSPIDFSDCVHGFLRHLEFRLKEDCKKYRFDSRQKKCVTTVEEEIMAPYVAAYVRKRRGLRGQGLPQVFPPGLSLNDLLKKMSEKKKKNLFQEASQILNRNCDPSPWARPDFDHFRYPPALMKAVMNSREWTQSDGFRSTMQKLSRSCQQRILERLYARVLLPPQLLPSQCRRDADTESYCRQIQAGGLHLVTAYRDALKLRDEGWLQNLDLESGLKCESPSTSLRPFFWQKAREIQSIGKCTIPDPGTFMDVDDAMGWAAVAMRYRLIRHVDGAVGTPPRWEIVVNSEFSSQDPKLAHQARDRVEACLKEIGPYLKGAGGETLVLRLARGEEKKQLPVQKVSIEAGNGRSNAGKYHYESIMDRNRGCSLVLHETLHLLGLPDGYRETIKGWVYDRVSRKMIFRDAFPIATASSQQFSPSWDCRTEEPLDSPMNEHWKAWAQVKNKKRESFLYPAQFCALTRPGCHARYRKYHECAAGAYDSGFNQRGGVGCPKKPPFCADRSSSWLVLPDGGCDADQ